MLVAARTKTYLWELYRSDPVKALKLALRRTRRGKSRELDGEKRMEALDKLLGGFGVEAIRGNWSNGFWGDVVATYVSFGDAYDSTVICQRTGRSRRDYRIFISSMGYFVERNSRKLGIAD